MGNYHDYMHLFEQIWEIHFDVGVSALVQGSAKQGITANLEMLCDQ